MHSQIWKDCASVGKNKKGRSKKARMWEKERRSCVNPALLWPADSFVSADVWAECRGWVQAGPQELCWHLSGLPLGCSLSQPVRIVHYLPLLLSPTGDNYPVQFIPSTMAAAAASGLNPLQLQVCTVTKEFTGSGPSPQHHMSKPAVC